MEANRRPRIVKRVPFLKRIVNAPEDYMMKVENDIRALDWDMLQEGLSWPLALGLNVLLVTVKMGYWLDDPYASVPSILRTDRSYYGSKSLWPGLSTFLMSLQYILAAVSFLNALWLFQSKKNYQMMHRPLDEAPPVSSYKMVEFQKDGSHWSSRFPGRLIYPCIAPFVTGPSPQEDKLQVWQMSLWDPSILSRNLFCWFSPAQVLIMLGMNSDNIHVFLPLSIVVAMQVHFLVSVYQSYVKDKQVLFGEVYREYNDKFVHPRIFVRKCDKQVSTGTDTGDLDLRTSDHGRVSSQYVSGRNPKRFNHLKVPVSSSPLSLPSHTSRIRGVSQSTPSPSTSRSSRSSVSMDSESEEDEYGEECEEEEGDEAEIEEEEDEDEDEEDGEEDDEDEIDPDVDYDEEGEEPAVPHPTNALRIGKH